MRHILFTLKGCPFGLLDDEHIRNVLTNVFPHYLKLSLEFNLTSFNLKESHCRSSCESHINIHTWAENDKYVTFLHVVITQTLGLG